MTQQKRFIPNPNKISDAEQSFVNQKIENKSSQKYYDQKDQYKGRMISMSDSFYKKLNDYLKDHPTEGNRSSFIVRIVAEYIDQRV